MKIANIFSTVILTKCLDINKIHAFLLDSIIPKTGISSLQYRLKPDNNYITFYKSGKILITGFSSLDSIHPITERIISILKKIPLDVSIAEIRIHNIVVVDTIGHKVQLDKIVASLPDTNIEYEPEQFPGMIIKEDGLSFLLFSSGKIVLTGVKDVESIEPALEKIKKKIQNTE